jgi:hypothetical protein
MRTARWVAVVTLGLLVGGSALAAPGRSGGGPGLIGRPEVQTELRLTEPQKKQATALLGKLESEMAALGRRLQGAGSAEQADRMVQETLAQQLGQVNQLLNPEQQKRFRQIRLQYEGLAAVAAPDVAAELHLTPDQKLRVNQILQQQATAMSSLLQRGGLVALREKMDGLRTDAEAGIASILSETQRNQWKELLGAPFKLAPAPARG